MGECDMKLLPLLVILVFLYACATQETSDVIPAFESESQMQCARDCELIHAGQLRSCTQRRTGSTRGGVTVDQCTAESYTTLRTCYRGCK